MMQYGSDSPFRSAEYCEIGILRRNDVYFSAFAFLLKCLQREVYRCIRTGRKTAVASDTFLMALEGVSEGV